MAATIKEIPAELFGKDLKKDASTAGTVYTLTPSRNSYILSGDSSAQTLIFSLENLSAQLTEIRAQSKSLAIRTKVPVGPNEFYDLYVPFSNDWEFSVDREFKVSKVSTLSIPPADPSFQFIEHTSPSFRINAANPISFTKDGHAITNGLINIVQVQKFSPKKDYILIEAEGSDFVLKLDHQRFLVSSSILYLIPPHRYTEVIALGSKTDITFNVASFLYINKDPKYVAPDAALWELENEYAGS